jgi:hypothetical protein
MAARAIAIVLALLAARPLAAQSTGGGWTLGVGARVVPLVTRAAPALAGRTLTEGYLTQPVVMLHLSPPGGRLALSGMLNLEGVTLERGELNAGIWGEGYVDRRHPHTYLHELVASARLARGASVTLGRGFAPFGTDDPMSRPMVKFPANHHLSQLLERWVAVGAARAGPAVLEGALFNGNEPNGVRDLSGLGRFGDSWAARLTLFPLRGVELQGSRARVAAPELPVGTRSEHRKWSASARFERSRPAAGEYALVEWARTGEHFGPGESVYDFRTLLAEASALRRGVELAARYEWTTRPEEERLSDPFRSPRPHSDVQLLGETRWGIATARVALAGSGAPAVRARPFLELARATVAKRFATQVFDPVDFYGANRLWSVSLGVRLEAGSMHERMGRYGAAVATLPAAGIEGMDMGDEHHH